MKPVIEILKLLVPYVGDIIRAFRGKGKKVTEVKEAIRTDSTTTTKPI